MTEHEPDNQELQPELAQETPYTEEGVPAQRPGTEMHPDQAEILAFRQRLKEVTPWVIVTPLIILANVAVFVLMAANGVSIVEPTAADGFAWGASYGPATTDGQWWRYFSAMFVHYGIIHIGVNMAVLWDGGHQLERMLGPIPYLAVYIVTGLAGAITSVLVSPESVSAGASGAVFGVYGCLFAIMFLHKRVVPRAVYKDLGRGIIIFIGYNIVVGVGSPAIDMGAHVGGLVAGFICGGLLWTKLEEKTERARRLRALTVLGLFAVALAATIYLVPKADGSLIVVKASETETYGSVTYHYQESVPKEVIKALDVAVKNAQYTADSGADIFVVGDQHHLKIGLFANQDVEDWRKFEMANTVSKATGIDKVTLQMLTAEGKIIDEKSISSLTFKVFFGDYKRLQESKVTLLYYPSLEELAKRAAPIINEFMLENKWPEFVFYLEKRNSNLFLAWEVASWHKREEDIEAIGPLLLHLQEKLDIAFHIRLITASLTGDEEVDPWESP